ncbi:acyl-CoA dehydrogenase [Novosphingobium sp. M1R2S20]|uniref:Acyl-CoA dehydrogenase n=1 Tax=Novosphingobium rhizovicinum TaxID=3228928 RepID=A0ABV3R9Z2_9SPHN
MNFDLTEEQGMVRDTFARFLDENSSTVRVRKAMETGGFDQELWSGLAELGAFAMRVPEHAGGMGLGVFDAALLMEEAGRTLVSGPLAEALVATRLLAQLGGAEELLEQAIGGEAVVSIAMHDLAAKPVQWIAGGAVAQAVVGRKGNDVVLVTIPESARKAEENLATTPIAEIDLGALETRVLGSGAAATFEAAIEEWKLYMSIGLSGIGREALRLASVYANERKAFGQLIGTFQGISHPLADLLCDIDGAKFLAWKAIHDMSEGSEEAAPCISLAYWYACDAAARSVAQGLHTFGGYGLSVEYDIHLFNLRAKAWPLVMGDPQLVLEEAGRRLYAGEKPALPDVGEVPIDFDLGDEARAVCAELAELFSKVPEETKAKFHYSWEGYVPEVHKMLAEHNLLFPGLPEHISGRNITPYARIAAMGELERQGYNTPGAGVASMVAMMIDKYGSDELKQEVLPKIIGGDVLCSLGYSEPSCGSDVFAAQCKATQLEDGSWRIDGTKMWTSGANLASYVLMLTRTNSNVPKHKGLTMFIVPLKTDGVTVQAVHTFQDERTNITFYDGVTIPDSWRLGEIDGGVKTMSAALELEHGGGFSKAIKGMIEAAEEVCEEMGILGETRTQCRLARTYAHLWVSDMLAYRSQWASVEKKPNHGYGPMAKMYSSEVFLSDSRDLLDLTAPLSLSKRPGAVALLNQCYRHAAGTTIYGGTSEVHRSMVAERGLGLPRTRG